jgi:hypothetical protein
MIRFAAALLAISLLSSVAAPTAAEAKGCIRGAIAGGVAGHMVHHTWTGAAAGCLAARHFYKEKARQSQHAPQPQQPQDVNGY